VPSRKQRRRREKLKRHEYEYVIETETGEEIPVESPREREKTKDGGSTAARGKTRAPVTRRGREVPEPSFRRTLRRGAIFAPLIAVLIYVTTPEEDRTVVAIVFNVVILLAFFLPFSYLIDVLIHRAVKRRRERAGPG
jgi:hypothetical protein